MLDIELEEQLVLGRCPASGDECGAHSGGEGGVVAVQGSARDVEFVVPVRHRKGVDGVAAVAPQVTLLRRVRDQAIEAAFGQDRTERVETRATVLANRGEIAES